MLDHGLHRNQNVKDVSQTRGHRTLLACFPTDPNKLRNHRSLANALVRCAYVLRLSELRAIRAIGRVEVPVWRVDEGDIGDDDVIRVEEL